MHKINNLIGSADAAKKLEIDRSTLSRWTTAGKITPALVGNGKSGEKFFNLEDIEALAAGSSPATDEHADPAPKRVAS